MRVAQNRAEASVMRNRALVMTLTHSVRGDDLEKHTKEESEIGRKTNVFHLCTILLFRKKETIRSHFFKGEIDFSFFAFLRRRG